MNNKNVWQHNKLVPMDKKKTSVSVFSNSQNVPPEFSTPGGGERTPKKEGVEKGKRQGLGKVTHQETN